MDQYYGKLTSQEIEHIQDAFDYVNEKAPCHINATIRHEIMTILKEKFLMPESVTTPELSNKMIETITIQH